MPPVARHIAGPPDSDQNRVADVEACFAGIRDAKGQGSTVFSRTYEALALRAAADADARWASGTRRSPLDGVTVSIKDLFDVAGETTTAGAPALANEPPATRDAVVVSRLRDAGAVIVGKTNMTQFALSCLGVNPQMGTPLSPWMRGEGRIAGGSSSGAAASVADNLAAVAVGTDTGGSVRVPAAFCGLVGFKPTARRVDLTGVFSLSRSLDSIGPIGRSVQDCAILDSVLSGRTGEEVAPVERSDLTLGVPTHGLIEGLDAEVARAFEAALDRLDRAGVRLVDVPLPVLMDTEALAGLGSFSIIEGGRDHAELFARLGHRCDPRVMDRFRSGASISDETYGEMLSLRARIIAQRPFDCDAVVYPTVSIVPPRLDGLEDEAAYLAANARIYRNAGVANLLDACAISLPCHDRDAAPAGFTLMGRSGEDRALLNLAAHVEQIVRSPH